MDSTEFLIIAAFVVIGIIAVGALAFCFWWFAGYLCVTFGWYALDANAQIVTWVVLVTIGCSGGFARTN